MVMIRVGGTQRPQPARLLLLSLVLPSLAVLIINQPLITFTAFILSLCAVVLAGIRLLVTHKKDVILLLCFGLAFGLGLGTLQTHLSFVERESAYTSLPEQSIGGVRLVLEQDSLLTEEGMRRYTGSLVSVTDRSGDVTGSARGKVAVFVPGGERLYWGETIQVKGKLKRSRAWPDIPFIMNARRAHVASLGFSSSLLAGRKQVVSAMLTRIERLGPPASSLLQALLLGVKDDLDYQLKEAFMRTGSLHLLALSGLHVGVIGAIVLFLLMPLRSKKLKVVLAAGAVLIYYFLAGPSPSLTRAVLMLGLAGVGYLLNRQVDLLQLLLVTALLIVLVDPVSTRSLSFQLSFAALLGILTLGQRLERILVPWLPRFVRLLVAASVSAQIFTAPLVLASFGSIYPVGIMASPVLIPLTTVFVWTGLICLIVGLVPWAPVTVAVQFIMNVQYAFIRMVSNFFSRIPGISLAWNNWFWLPALLLVACLAVGIKVKRQGELRFPV